jgi:hypothetical protein
MFQTFYIPTCNMRLDAAPTLGTDTVLEDLRFVSWDWRSEIVRTVALVKSF